MFLTYHLRTVGQDGLTDEFREFFNNIIATNKMRNTVGFFQDNEESLFGIYSSFQGMSAETFAETYRKYRRRLEFSGYAIESFRMAAKDELTEEDLQKSKERVDAWEQKILEAREANIISLKAPKHKRNRKMKRVLPAQKEGYTLEDVKCLTKDITPADVKRHLSDSIAKKRGRDGRYR